MTERIESSSLVCGDDSAITLQLLTLIVALLKP